MSDDKKYTAEEVARMIADRAAEVIKKHEVSSEYFEQILKKSKNKAHEIDNGEEPNNDDAECPASLCESGESEKSESSEPASMEDQPLQGDEDSDTEKEETEDDDEEDKEDKYEFKKSEACGHIIEYKRLAKRCWEGYEPTPGKKAYEKGSCQKKSEEEVVKCGDMKKEEDGEMSVGKAVAMIMSDKHGVDDVMDKVPAEMRSKVMAALRSKDAKKAEMCKGYMDKCGDMKIVKFESGMHTIEYKRLAKARFEKERGLSDEGKRTVRAKRNKDLKEKGVHLKQGDYTLPKEKAKEKFFQRKKERTKIERDTNPSKAKEITENQKKAGWGQHQKDPSKTTNVSQAQGIKAATGKDVPVDPKKNTKIFREDDKPASKLPKSEAVYKNEDNKVKETKGIDFDKPKDSDKTKEKKKSIKRPLEKCGEMKKEEMDKCGDMTSGKKLKKFMSKKSQK